MKKFILPYLAAVMSLLHQPVLCQEDSTALLGLPGDNLDLYAVLTVFQKSKTIEEFEKTLNAEESKINNLDLNLDKKVDFIKVVAKKKDDSHTFILQVDVTKDETQDVAVILLDKDKNKKISLQIVGNEDLYGKDYVIEPKGNSSITPNPAYTGENPVTVTVPAPTTTTVVVESAPIVQHVYSPVYVPYTPPYHYGYYPPWFGFATVMAVGIYRHNHYHYHGGYHGGHYGGGNVVINNNNFNNFNNYNNNKMRSNTVSDNRAKGNYGNRSTDRAGNRASASTRPSTRESNRASTRESNRASAGTSNRQSPGVSNRQSSGNFDRASTGGFDRASSRPSTSNYSGSGRTRSGGSGMRGGGGGGMRGGGGGRRR
jgi:hypothetical protein